MKYILTTREQYAIVDDENYDYLNQWKWKLDSKGYAVRQTSRKLGKRKIVYMHREVAKTPQDMLTDHKNFNKLDNRRKNLRICTKRENQIHQTNSRNTSGIRGISYDKNSNKWIIQFSPQKYKYKRIYLNSKQDAIKKYNKMVKKYYGEFGILASL